MTSAGTPGYVYNQGGVTTATTGPGLDTSTTHTFTGIGAGTHTFAVTDANGCTSNTVSIVVTPSATPLSLGTASVVAPIACNGGTTAIGLSVTGGSGVYTFTLGTMSFTANQNSHTFTGVSPGSYAYSVTDGNGCSVSSVADVDVNEPSDTPAYCLATGAMYCPSTCRCTFLSLVCRSQRDVLTIDGIC